MEHCRVPKYDNTSVLNQTYPLLITLRHLIPVITLRHLIPVTFSVQQKVQNFQFKRGRYLSRYSDWLRVGRSEDRIPVEARFSAPVQTGPGAHPTFCTMGTRSFPGINSGRGVTLTPHPLLVPLVMKE